MLDELEPREFDEWMAFRRLEPDPDEHLRTIVRLGFLAVLRQLNLEIEPRQLDPWYEEPAAPEMNQDKAEALLRSFYGR